MFLLSNEAAVNIAREGTGKLLRTDSRTSISIQIILRIVDRRYFSSDRDPTFTKTTTECGTGKRSHSTQPLTSFWLFCFCPITKKPSNERECAELL